MLEVEYYRRLAEAALDRPDRRGRGPRPALPGRPPDDPAGLRRALVGRRFTAARRRGKLLLLDTGSGAATASLGIRFGMTGGLLVDDRAAVDRLLLRRPAATAEQWVRLRLRLRRRRRAGPPRPPALRAGRRSTPTRRLLGPDAVDGHRGRGSRARPGRPGARRRAAAQGPAPRPEPAGRGREPAGRRDPLAGLALARAAPRRRSPAAELRRLHRHLRATLERAGGAGRLAHRRPDATSAVRAAAARATAPSWCRPRSAAAPPGGARPTSAESRRPGNPRVATVRSVARPLPLVTGPAAPRLRRVGVPGGAFHGGAYCAAVVPSIGFPASGGYEWTTPAVIVSGTLPTSSPEASPDERHTSTSRVDRAPGRSPSIERRSARGRNTVHRCVDFTVACRRRRRRAFNRWGPPGATGSEMVEAAVGGRRVGRGRPRSRRLRGRTGERQRQWEGEFRDSRRRPLEFADHHHGTR